VKALSSCQDITVLLSISTPKKEKTGSVFLTFLGLGATVACVSAYVVDGFFSIQW